MSGYFDGRKLIVVGGSSGMGRQTATDVVRQGGSAVVVGRQAEKVYETAAELGKTGDAWGLTADLADRHQVAQLQEQLAAEHSDATLLVNAAGFFAPKAFLEYGEEDYDADLELNRALFSWAVPSRPNPTSPPQSSSSSRQKPAGSPERFSTSTAA
jgi:NAD(P)-dependent dehydrogenase (short-subunit alcohol dehydrogenase family)